MKFISWIVTLPAALLAVALAVSNREAVRVALWPVPGSFETPLYAVVLVAVIIGFVAGGAVASLSAGRARRRARQERHRAEAAEDNLSRLRQDQAEANADQRRSDAA